MDGVLLVPTRYFGVLVLVLHVLSVTLECQLKIVTSSAHGPQFKCTTSCSFARLRLKCLYCRLGSVSLWYFGRQRHNTSYTLGNQVGHRVHHNYHPLCARDERGGDSRQLSGGCGVWTDLRAKDLEERRNNLVTHTLTDNQEHTWALMKDPPTCSDQQQIKAVLQVPQPCHESPRMPCIKRCIVTRTGVVVTAEEHHIIITSTHAA